MLVLSFIVSPDLLAWLRQLADKIVVVSDPLRASEATEVTYRDDKMMTIHPKTASDFKTTTTFHPKLIAMRFPTHLRLVIATGNILECDWESYSNAFFLRDCPVRVQATTQPAAPLTALDRFLQKVLPGVSEDVKEFLGLSFEDFNWPWPGQAVLFSAPGHLNQSDKHKGGLLALKDLLTRFRPRRPYSLKHSTIHYLTSSLTKLSFKLMQDFASSLVLDPSEFALEMHEIRPRLIRLFRVLWPSQQYVAGSFLGASNCLGLFLKRSVYESFAFVPDVLRQYQGDGSVVGGRSVVPHLKAFVVVNDGKIDDDSLIYSGSHNFTSAAWGKVDKEPGNATSHNFELGLVFLPQKGSRRAKENLAKKLGLDLSAPAFNDLVQPFFDDAPQGNRPG